MAEVLSINKWQSSIIGVVNAITYSKDQITIRGTKRLDVFAKFRIKNQFELHPANLLI